MAKVRLAHNEQIKAESDAMAAMSGTIDVDGKLEGGIMGGIGRMFSGEKFFFQTLTARRGPGDVYLSPAMPGDIAIVQMDGTIPYIVQKDGFFAASSTVNVTTKLQNLAKGLFSGEGFFVMKASGKGTLLVSSYGAVHGLEIPDGEELVIDNHHLVAWPEHIKFTLEKAAASWISSVTSGEGLVCRFRGPGKVFIQTRNPSGLGEWIRTNINNTK